MVGVAPFMKIAPDVFSMAWTNRDFAKRKSKIMEESKSFYSAEFMDAVFYLYFIPVATKVAEGMIRHLEKRGISCNYWVLNCDDEVALIAKRSNVSAILTDRPEGV